MRVIAGEARGITLTAPPGTDTRPTVDRVKEAAFSIIQTKTPDAIVLDLFAGSGGLGIEALSRGASWCDFVERDRHAAQVIHNNLQKTRLAERASVTVSDAKDFTACCKRKYDIALLDPPYGKKLCDFAMDALSSRGCLNPGAVAVCETAAGEDVASPFRHIKSYRYGTVSLLLFEAKVGWK